MVCAVAPVSPAKAPTACTLIVHAPTCAASTADAALCAAATSAAPSAAPTHTRIEHAPDTAIHCSSACANGAAATAPPSTSAYRCDGAKGVGRSARPGGASGASDGRRISRRSIRTWQARSRQVRCGVLAWRRRRLSAGA
jgi:hypothetical protein